MDFIMLPPEINSARIYAGPGPGPLMGAARAWTMLSSELYSAASELRSVITTIAATWMGPSSQAMTRTATSYARWLMSTASSAQHTASQATAAAEAFTTARAASVAPPVIAANRALLTHLVASNLFGQNTPAIAATEAAYAEFWAQDAAAMNAYAAGSAAATAGLPHFTPAPQTTTGATPQLVAAVPDQATIGELLAAFLTQLEGALGLNSGILTDPLFGLLASTFQSIVSSGFPINIVQLFAAFFGPIFGSSMIAGTIAAQGAATRPSAPVVVNPPSAAAAPKPAPVKAAAAAGGRIGPMRVPPSWAQPQSKPEPSAATPLPPSQSHPIGLPVIPFVPVTGGRARKHPRATDPDTYPIGLPVKMTPPRNPSGG